MAHKFFYIAILLKLLACRIDVENNPDTWLRFFYEAKLMAAHRHINIGDFRQFAMPILFRAVSVSFLPAMQLLMKYLAEGRVYYEIAQDMQLANKWNDLIKQALSPLQQLNVDGGDSEEGYVASAEEESSDEDQTDIDVIGGASYAPG